MICTMEERGKEKGKMSSRDHPEKNGRCLPMPGRRLAALIPRRGTCFTTTSTKRGNDSHTGGKVEGGDCQKKRVGKRLPAHCLAGAHLEMGKGKGKLSSFPFPTGGGERRIRCRCGPEIVPRAWASGKKKGRDISRFRKKKKGGGNFQGAAEGRIPCPLCQGGKNGRKSPWEGGSKSRLLCLQSSKKALQ